MALLMTLGIALGALLLILSIWQSLHWLMPIAVAIIALSAIRGLSEAGRSHSVEP